MTQREAKLLHRIQECLHKMGNMAPSNPMDTVRKVIACDLGCDAAIELYYAISDLGDRSFVSCRNRINDAEAIIGKREQRIEAIRQSESRLDSADQWYAENTK